MAARITRGLFQESKIFEAYNLHKHLIVLVWLFPTAPLILYLATAYLGIIVAIILTIACFIPGFVIARQQRRVLERTGTDKTKRALVLVNNVNGLALIGLIYVSCIVVITFVKFNL